MTEPVAYMWKTANGTVLGFQEYKENTPYPGYVTPLYTAESLHPHVKMTQAEFDEFTQLYKESSFKRAAFVLWDIENDYKFHNLRDRFGVYIKDLPTFANLWVEFNEDCPEETIEIIKDEKWFVRSKEKYHPDMDQGITESGYLYLTQGDIYSIEYYETTPFKDEAQQFDTKEEAEKWTNPLTEAVRLPVEDE